MNSRRGNFVGIEQPLSCYVGPGGRLVIGEGCGLSNCTIVAMESVEIGPQTLIGGGTRIYDTDFHALECQERLRGGAGPAKAVKIGARCFIGGHVLILKGVSIGEESIIGAGSVVLKDIPAGEIWAGVPARFLRKADQTK